MSRVVGQRLRAAREAKQAPLEEACRVTKIQRRTLEAIEEGEVGEILSPAYTRIFIRRYADYLGLDGAAIAREYLGSAGPVPEPSVQVQTEITRQSSEGRAWPRILVPAGAAAVALVGIGFLVYLTADLVATLRKAPTVPPTASPVAESPAPPLVPLSKPLELTVRTTDKVWLQVKSDGDVIFQNVLPKGSRESWTAKRELELWTGNAAAMELTLNGKRLEGLGRGVKRGVKVTHAGLKLP